MSFYKQIAIIVLFFIILFLFFAPSSNNFLLITLKGISSGALILIFIQYAFPSILYSEKSDVPNNEFDDISEYSKVLDSNDLKYKKLVKSILDGIRSTNDHYSSALYLINKETLSFETRFSDKNIFKTTVPLENNFLNDIILNKENKVENKKQDVSTFWNELIDKEDWRGSESMIGFPVTYKEHSIGVLVVFIDHFSKINTKDKTIITTFVDILNEGISSIEEFESNISRQNNIDRIQSLYSDFDPESEISNFLDSVVEVSRSIFTYDKLTICFDTDNSDELEIAITDGFDEDALKDLRFDLRNNIIGLSYVDNELIVLDRWKLQFPEIKRFNSVDQDNIKFDMILSSPLRSEGKAVGNFTIERIDKSFTNEEVELVTKLTDAMNNVLSWISTHHQLSQSATRDGLTGLLNHKTFLERFEKEINRSNRFEHELGLIFFDIDKFKSINDTYGHLYGDYVLEEVSRIISKNVRSIDIVGRYGGEEFSVILVNTNIKDCIPLAEKIVKKIAKKTYLKDGIAVNLTISAGMSGFPVHSDSIRDLIGKADKAMYQTKLKGGNGVSIAE
tara:strand:- start:2747 stop:4435 length:1689 start_codon:yes stop_codon:yes gene_type:complete